MSHVRRALAGLLLGAACAGGGAGSPGRDGAAGGAQDRPALDSPSAAPDRAPGDAAPQGGGVTDAPGGERGTGEGGAAGDAVAADSGARLDAPPADAVASGETGGPGADTGAGPEPGPDGGAGTDAAVSTDAPGAADRPDGGGPSGPGSVAAISGACAAGPLARTTCRRVRVACPGIPSIDAEVRITQPAGSARAGTVVFATGGDGTSWFDRYPASAAMMQALSDDGYLLVQRAWASAWERGPGGMAAVSCRYAALLGWAHDTYHTTGGFCTTGGSGGSAEVGYALAHWGMASVLDYALPTSGPPMGRLDRGCLDSADPGWLAQCAGYFDRLGICTAGRRECAYDVGNGTIIDAAYTPATPCADRDGSYRSRFLADSVAAPSAAYDYGATVLHFVFAADDCSPAVPLGMPYYDAIVSRKSHEVLTGVEHSIHASVKGANRIGALLRAACRPR